MRIIYADALVRRPDLPEGSFDLLIANPPYSVRGFLATLSEEDRVRYELSETVPASSIESFNGIETFFVERAAQLLKPCGIAAVILPSSILSNGAATYVRCRDILLRSFDIVAIAEFGSGTFGKTGTNTVTLFLRKKDSPPDFAVHCANRADAWLAAKHDGDEVRNNRIRRLGFANQTAPSARSSSAVMSSMGSRPMEGRISSGRTLPLRRSSSESSEWVVEAGWMTSDEANVP